MVVQVVNSFMNRDSVISEVTDCRADMDSWSSNHDKGVGICCSLSHSEQF
jgi:hypothetical protein